MASEEDLRNVASALLKRRREQEHEESTESIAPQSKRKRSAGELARAAAAPGAGVIGVAALLAQLLQARISPEQLKALQERVDAIEVERSQRRFTEYERDRISSCRSLQTEEFLRTLLPRADSQVGQLPKPWFDKCPELPQPTTGAKPAAK
jgi:uncharacterized protein HemX